MSDSYARRHPPIVLDAETIAAMLRPALPGRSIESFVALSGGYINTNYHVRIAGSDDSYVLRLYAHDPACCQKERNLFRLVHDRIPVPEVVYADTDGERFGRPYSVNRWVDGVKLDAVVASGSAHEVGSAAYAAGMALADICAFTFDATGFLTPELTIAQPFEEGFDWFRAHLEQNLFGGKPGERLGEGTASRLFERSMAYRHLLDSVEQRRSLVHADYRLWNLLMKRDGDLWRVAGVLDWEFAFSGWPLVDVGGMLRVDNELPSPFESEFVRGFEEHCGHLPSEWKKIGKLLDLVNVLDFLDAPEEAAGRIEIGRKAALRTIHYLEE